MVFQIFAKFNESCVDRCACANNFVEHNKRCVAYVWVVDNHFGEADNDYSMVSFVLVLDEIHYFFLKFMAV